MQNSLTSNFEDEICLKGEDGDETPSCEQNALQEATLQKCPVKIELSRPLRL